MKKGFTLLESIIYIALTSMIISILVVSSYQIIEGNYELESRSIQNEEIDFIVHKIESTLNDVSHISTPSEGATGRVLEVYRNNYSDNPIRLEFSLPTPESAGRLSIKVGSAPDELLSGNVISIRDLIFERSGSASTSRFIKATLTAGVDSFEIIKYLP